MTGIFEMLDHMQNLKVRSQKRKDNVYTQFSNAGILDSTLIFSYFFRIKNYWVNKKWRFTFVIWTCRVRLQNNMLWRILRFSGLSSIYIFRFFICKSFSPFLFLPKSINLTYSELFTISSSSKQSSPSKSSFLTIKILSSSTKACWLSFKMFSPSSK